MGRALVRLGDLVTAERVFARTRIAGDFASMQRRIAGYYEEAGHVKDAARILRQALLAEVAQRKVQLPDKQILSEDAEKEYLAELESWQNAWNQSGDLPASQAQPLEEQFSQHINAIRRQLEASRYERQMQQDMASLLVAAEKILNSKQPVTEQQVKSLEKRRKQRDWPTDSARLALRVPFAQRRGAPSGLIPSSLASLTFLLCR